MLEVLAEDRHNPGCRFAIPKWRTLGLGSGFLEDILSGCENTIWVHSDHLIGAVLNRCGPFRVFTQREARHSEDRRFLLYATGVC